MRDDPKVSIITVSYNAEDHIQNAIESVLAQEYGNIEYIIVDGQSSDKTLEVVSRYKNKIAKIISEKDNGIYDAMNKGVKASTGDIVYFLNADDRLHDSLVISDIASEFSNHPDTAALYGRVEVKNIPKELGPEFTWREIINRKIDFLDSTICHQALFVRKSLFEEIGLFDTRYKVTAEYDWLLSLFDSKAKIEFIDRHIAFYDLQGFSFRNFKQGRRERTRILYRHFSLPVFLFYLARYVFWEDAKSKAKQLLLFK